MPPTLPPEIEAAIEVAEETPEIMSEAWIDWAVGVISAEIEAEIAEKGSMDDLIRDLSPQLPHSGS